MRGMLIAVVVTSGFAVFSSDAEAGRYTDFSEPELEPTIQGENVVAAGETQTLTLAVQNRHDGLTKTDSGIDSISQIIQSNRINIGAATSTSVTVDSGDAPLDVRTGRQALGTIDAGSHRQTAVTVEVDENAAPGTYRLPVTVSYSYIFSISTDRNEYTINRNTETTTEYVTIRIDPSARLAVVNTTGQNLYENAEGTVSVTVRNDGSEAANDAVLNMEESSVLQPKSAGVSVGRLAPGETARASFQVGVAKSDIAGDYAAPFQLQYEDENGVVETSAVRTGSLALARAPKYDVSVETAELYVGSTGTVEMTVTNTGERTVRDARAELEPLQPFSLVSSKASLGTLSPGESGTARFKLEVSDQAVAQTHPLAVTVVHDDAYDNAVKSEPQTVEVTVGPEPTYNVSVETTELYVDSTGTVEITVTNTGERTVRDARAELEPLQPFSLVSSTASLGTLSPGESGTARFKLEASDQAVAQTYPLAVTVVHEDDYNNDVKSEPQTVDVAVGPETTIQVIDTAQVSAGGTETVMFTIRNTGEETLSDAVARINTNSPFDTDDDTAYIGELAPGEQTTVSYTVSTGSAATPKVYSLDMSVKYDNALDNTVVTDTRQAPIRVTADSGGLPFGLTGIAVIGTVAPLLVGLGIMYRGKLLSKIR